MAWNSLPDFIRDPTISTDCFRRLLKMHLFARYWCIQRISGSQRLCTIQIYALTHSLTHSMQPLLCYFAHLLLLLLLSTSYSAHPVGHYCSLQSCPVARLAPTPDASRWPSCLGLCAIASQVPACHLCLFMYSGISPSREVLHQFVNGRDKLGAG